MPKEKSVGCVLFRFENNEPKFLLLHYKAGHWGFPKGHVEAGETEKETLLRELREETSLTDVQIVPGFKQQTSYFFKGRDGTTFKEVVFYLLESNTGRVRLSHEHTGFQWLPFEKAVKKLSFKNTKNVLSRARDFLQQRRLQEFSKK